jgi:hypothetical protein
MAERPGRGSDQFVVRLPDGMRDYIADAAKANGRSMNAEIVARLEESFRGTLPPGNALEEYTLDLIRAMTEAFDDSLRRSLLGKDAKAPAREEEKSNSLIEFLKNRGLID